MTSKLSHARIGFYLAAVAGLMAWGLARHAVPYLALVIGVDVFFAAYLAKTLSLVPGLDAARMRENARSSDEPLWMVLLVTLSAAVLAVVLVISLGDKANRDWATTILTLASLPLAWTTIHTMMAWHYAHMYWRKIGEPDPDEGTPAGDEPPATGAPAGFHGGLLFPGRQPPGASDFLYFSFIIGVAAQTADVAISSSRIRRVSLVHSLVAFVFNTILLAAVINVVVSLA